MKYLLPHTNINTTSTPFHNETEADDKEVELCLQTLTPNENNLIETLINEIQVLPCIWQVNSSQYKMGRKKKTSMD